MIQQTSFKRINTLLHYIQGNIDQPLSLECLAAQSGWSRWQLQRVFQHYTGTNVAQYVREQKLSGAAIEVLSKQKRMLDIAYSFGFNSEIAFSRAFKNHFNCSPRIYQKEGKQRGIKSPFINAMQAKFNEAQPFLQVRLEYKPSFTLVALPTYISGLLSTTPNFQEKIPSLWQEVDQFIPTKGSELPKFGAIDTRQNDPDKITYWTGGEYKMHPFSTLFEEKEETQLLTIPAQQYAVMAFKGPATTFSAAIEWFICDGLPDQQFSVIEGFEIEVYRQVNNIDDQEIDAEYWLPIDSH